MTIPVTSDFARPNGKSLQSVSPLKLQYVPTLHEKKERPIRFYSDATLPFLKKLSEQHIYSREKGIMIALVAMTTGERNHRS